MLGKAKIVQRDAINILKGLSVRETMAGDVPFIALGWKVAGENGKPAGSGKFAEGTTKLGKLA